MSRDFVLHNAVLLGTMGLLVGVVRAGVPGWMRRFTTARWALLLPVPICAVVVAISVLPDSANVLTWLAFLAVPPGAALALGWALLGGRWVLAVLAIPLFVLAWSQQDTNLGDLTALVLAALSCVTLGRLLAGLTPLGWLKLGVIALGIADAILVFGNSLEHPNAILNAAIPARGLPQLQFAHFGPANLGYGDLFAAGVLGGIVAAERRLRWLAALLTFALCEAWTLLFYVTDVLPMTVPVAIVVILLETPRIRREVARWRPRSSPDEHAGVAGAPAPTSSSARGAP